MRGGAGPALALGEPQQLVMALLSPFGRIVGNWEWVEVAVEVLPPAADDEEAGGQVEPLLGLQRLSFLPGRSWEL